MTGFPGGLQIRGLPIPGDWDTEPVADYLCGRCGHHQRATGRQQVQALIAAARIDHNTRCPSNRPAATTTRKGTRSR